MTKQKADAGRRAKIISVAKGAEPDEKGGRSKENGRGEERELGLIDGLDLI